MSGEIRITIEGDNEIGPALQAAAQDLAKFSKTVGAATDGVEKLDQSMAGLASTADNADATSKSLVQIADAAKTLNKVLGDDDSRGLIRFVDFLENLSEATASSPILKSVKNLEKLGGVMSNISGAFASLDVSGDKARVANALGNMLKSLGTVERLNVSKLQLRVDGLGKVFESISTAVKKLDGLATDKRVTSVKSVETLAKSLSLLSSVDVPTLDKLASVSLVDNLTGLERISVAMSNAMKKVDFDQSGVAQKIGVLKNFVSALSQLSKMDMGSLTNNTTGDGISKAVGSIRAAVNRLSVDDDGKKIELDSNAAKSVASIKNLVSAMSGLSKLDLSSVTDDKLASIGTHMGSLMAHVKELGGSHTNEGAKAVSSISSLIRAVSQLGKLDVSGIGTKDAGRLKDLSDVAIEVGSIVGKLSVTKDGAKAVSSISGVIRAISMLNKLETSAIGDGKTGTLKNLQDAAQAVQTFVGTLSVTKDGAKAVSSISGVIRAISMLNRLETSAIGDDKAGNLKSLKDVAGAVQTFIGTLSVTKDAAKAVSSISGVIRAVSMLNSLDTTSIGNDKIGTLKNLQDAAQAVQKFIGTLSVTKDGAKAVSSISGVVRAVASLNNLQTNSIEGVYGTLERLQRIAGAVQAFIGTLSVTKDGAKAVSSISGVIRAVSMLNSLETSAIGDESAGNLKRLQDAAQAVQAFIGTLSVTKDGAKAVSSISAVIRAVSSLNSLETSAIGDGKTGKLKSLQDAAQAVQAFISTLSVTKDGAKAVSSISGVIRAVSTLNNLDTTAIGADGTGGKLDALKKTAHAVKTFIDGMSVTKDSSQAVSSISNLVRAVDTLGRLDTSKIGDIKGTGTLSALVTHADQLMAVVNNLGKNATQDSGQAVASISNLVRSISMLSKLDLTGLSAKTVGPEIESSVNRLATVAQKLAGMVSVDATKSINAFSGLIRALESISKIDTSKLASNLGPAVSAMTSVFTAMQGMSANVGKGVPEAARAISSLMSSVAKLAAVDTQKLKEVMQFLSQGLLKPGSSSAQNQIAAFFGLVSKTSFNSTSDSILRLGKSIEGATKGMMALDKLTNSIQRLSKLDADGLKNIATNLKSVIGLLNQELPSLVVPMQMEALGNVLGAFPGLAQRFNAAGAKSTGGSGGGGMFSSMLSGGGFGRGGGVGSTLMNAAGGLFNFGKTVLPPVFKGVGNVVSAPFKAVGGFFKAQFSSLTNLADEMVRPLSGISTELKKYAVYKGIYEVENLVRNIFTGTTETLREFEMFDIGLQGMYAAEYAKDQATITRTFLGPKGLNEEDQYKLDKAKIDYAQMGKDIQFYEQELRTATNSGKESQVELDRRRLKIQELRLEMTNTAREIKELEEVAAEPNYSVIRTDEKKVADVLNTPEVTGAVGRLRNWVEDLAIWSQYDFEGIGNALRTAISYGFPLITGEAQDVVQIVTDYASRKGFGADQIERITLALGQIKSSKNLRGTEVRQLSEVGINIYEILADSMGKSIEDVTAMQANGEIKSADALGAIFGAMKDQSEGAAREMSLTFGGLINSMQDTLKFGTERLFGPMREVLKPLMLSFVEAYMGDGVDDESPMKALLTKTGERLAGWVQGGLDTGFDNLFGEGGLNRFIDWALQEPGTTIGGWTAKLIEFVGVVREVGGEWWNAIKPIVDFGVYIKDSIQDALGRIINAKDVVNGIFVLVSLGITRMIGGSVLGFLQMLIPLATLGTAMATLRTAWESNTWGVQQFGKALKDQITLKALPDFNQAIMDHGIGALTEFQELFSGKQTEFGHFRALLGDIGAIVGDVFKIVKDEWNANWPQTQAWIQEKWTSMWLGDQSLPEEEQGGIKKFITDMLNSAYEGDPEVEEDGIGGWVSGFITRMINDVTEQVPTVIQTLNTALVDGIDALQKLEGAGAKNSIGGALINLLATIVVSLIPTVVTVGAILANALVSGILFALNSIDWGQLIQNNVSDPAMASLGWNIGKLLGAGNLMGLADLEGTTGATAYLKKIGWNARMLDDKGKWRAEYTQYMIDTYGADRLIQSYGNWTPADQSKVDIGAIRQAASDGRNAPAPSAAGDVGLDLAQLGLWTANTTGSNPLNGVGGAAQTMSGGMSMDQMLMSMMYNAQTLGNATGLTGTVGPTSAMVPGGGGGGFWTTTQPSLGYPYYPGNMVPQQWMGTSVPASILPTSSPMAPSTIDYDAWAEELINSLERAQSKNAPIQVNVSVESVPNDTTEQKVERASETGVQRALRSRGINAY